jgi:hypothetical protein
MGFDAIFFLYILRISVSGKPAYRIMRVNYYGNMRFAETLLLHPAKVYVSVNYIGAAKRSSLKTSVH